VDGLAVSAAACHAGGPGGTFSSTAIEIIKWVKFFAVAQAKVSHILRPGNTAFTEQLKLVNGFER
jgi:hypothetical protein